MTTSQTPDQWLIRTAENQISGPFSRQQICEFIKQGKLQLNDEVCHANTYWFYLHEHQEIQGQLGIELPKELYAGADEATQTETDTEITDPGVEPDGTRIAAMGTRSGSTGTTIRSSSRMRESMKEDDSIPELSQPIEELGENTAVMSNRAFRDFRQKKKTEVVPVEATASQISSAPTPTPAPMVRGISVEKSKLVQILTYIMMIGAFALLVFVIKLLRDQSG